MGLEEVPAYVEISMELLCKKCGRKRDVEKHFTRRKDSKRGYQYECNDCRREINKQYRKSRAKKAEESKPKEEPRKRTKNGNGSTKERHRRKLLEQAGTRIAAGELIAETPRSMTFNLSLIIEQQLRLHYGRQVTAAISRPKMNQIIDDALFEVKQALARAGNRMRPVIAEKDISLEDTLGNLRKKSAARELLGVSEGASQRQIKCAYRAKARRAHPDHSGSTEEMQKLNEAYALLAEDKDGR